MNMHNPFAGETPFPVAGEGVLLKFTSSDILRLHSIYGPDPRAPRELGEDGRVKNHFWTTILGRIEDHDPKALMDCLRAGLKEQGPHDARLKPLSRSEDWWDDLPFSFADASDIILNGIMWSRWMMTPDQLAQRYREAKAESEAAGEQETEADPQTGTTESPTSSAL